MTDYQSLADVFDELDELPVGRPEYSILRGVVYDTIRWHVQTDIPDTTCADVSRMLHRGDVESAEEKVSEYLDVNETEVL